MRLSSANRRIDAFLDQIDTLAASSFAHDDGIVALNDIRKHFIDLKEGLVLPEGAREDVLDAACLHVADQVSSHTAVLGFILRSTNLRNPFELHYVLKKLIRKALGHEAQLLISSEWAYVPFTYPMSIDVLPEHILIGSPAPESGNPLIIPLAAHEIGHSAWRMYGCLDEYSSVIADVVMSLSKEPKVHAYFERQQALGPLGVSVLRDRLSGYVALQLEEVFCDLFGLFLFGASYLFAYDYLLGPGDQNRSMKYPSDKRRIEFLADAAADLGMQIDPILTTRWNDAAFGAADRHMGDLVDEAVTQLVQRVRAQLFQILRSKELAPPDPMIVKEVQEAFERSEPFPESATLGEIITAGWLCLHSQDTDAQAKDRRWLSVLADLILKTIEVSEYLDRTLGNA